MTTALELVGVSLAAATLLIAAMFLLAFQLGRLITRDDEQRQVEVVQRPELAVDDLLISTACSRRARSSTSARPTGAARGGGRSRGTSSPSSIDGAGAVRRH